MESAIGVPMGLETSLRMPLGDYLRLAARLAPRGLVDATEFALETLRPRMPEAGRD